jgi:tRNA-specific 2-thiouridylase
MSGGVDSSVAAALLSRQQRPLIGFSMQLVDRLAGEDERYGRCCTPDDFRDARRVADSLGFPHYVVDMEDDFRRFVLEPFAADYDRGRTPSPCVRCNTFIKFEAFSRRAAAVGAERVATGHYARLERDASSARTLLLRAADRDKDQSYFLFDLSDDQRRRAEFPVGDLKKEQVRDIARELDLVTADKPESMDLCFVSAGDSYRGFLASRGLTPADAGGEIVDTAGRVLGTHPGISHYTVGQRRGLGVSAARPLYVVRVERDTRRVVVSSEDDLYRESCVIERVRWIPFDRPHGPLRATVRIRSGHGGAEATLTDHGDGRATVRFFEPQKAIAPGQAAVAYDGDVVLGGGWIAGG